MWLRTAAEKTHIVAAWKIDLETDGQIQTPARIKGRQPAAHRRAAPRQGDWPRQAQRIWVAQALPG